jgi:hypothetical protein
VPLKTVNLVYFITEYAFNGSRDVGITMGEISENNVGRHSAAEFHGELFLRRLDIAA